MQTQQATDALRHISSQVDRLLETLKNGGGGGGSQSSDAILQHLHHLVSILEPQELYQAITSSAVSLTGAQRGFLTMVEAGNKLRFKSGVGIDQQALGQPALAMARHAVKQVLQKGAPVAHPPQGPGGLHVLCVPLKIGKRLDGNERIGGAVYVDAPAQGRPLGEGQMRVLRQLAGQAAIALENAHIFFKSEQDRQQILRLKDNITKLYDVGQSIASTLILEELLLVIVDHVVEISRAQRGFIMFREGEQLVFKVGRNARKRTLREEDFRYSTTIAKKTIETKKSQIVLETMAADMSVSMMQMELQSIMCVPLLEKEEVFGLVYVDSQQSNKEFDKADLEIVESLAGQASIAIINAKLYREAGERERLAHELSLASRIQADLLPKQIPPVSGLEMYGLLFPALEVGGDYYDFIEHEGTQDSLTIAIGDVSGKGVGAGIVMAMARSALRSIVQHEKVPTSPLPIMRSLNVTMCRDIPPGMFITINLLIWDAARRTLTYAPAGHEHLLIYRAATRSVERIKAGGVACGVLKQASAMYKEHTLPLAPGDQLLLYTDGVTEAMDLFHQPFGLDTTEELVRKHGHLDPKTLCETIHREVVEFRGAADPHDDITLVALRAH